MRADADKGGDGEQGPEPSRGDALGQDEYVHAGPSLPTFTSRRWPPTSPETMEELQASTDSVILRSKAEDLPAEEPVNKTLGL